MKIEDGRIYEGLDTVTFDEIVPVIKTIIMERGRSQPSHGAFAVSSLGGAASLRHWCAGDFGVQIGCVNLNWSEFNERAAEFKKNFPNWFRE